ncbi:hypothetical protein M0G74_03165 [Microbulbifer sp. CAU 1566]|uniref:hypothetical protein n=1 Tax=Microbulbifer sp. CAU 1566 TaxID=2933269 RepID=UPI0020033860|nr:hypothetical protein [Microbulbifer sp. CAU 1566]MCK7596266.1 hypothetical protein [Microbulbifer sp. CAU 1566]
MSKFSLTSLMISALSALLIGCASSYTVTEQTKNRMAELNDQAAQQLLSTLLTKSEYGGGFCIGGLKMTSGFQDHDKLSVQEDGTLTFAAKFVANAEITGVRVLSNTNTVSITTKKEWRKGQFAMNLDEIKSIRVKDTDGSFSSTFCEGLSPGKLVMVEGAGDLGFFINVKDDQLDNLMAGLLHFSKNTSLKQGLGF